MVKKKLTDKEKEVLFNIWSRIKKAREEKGFKPSQFAKETWIDRSFLSQIEKWEVNFSYLKLYRIIEVLNNETLLNELNSAKSKK